MVRRPCSPSFDNASRRGNTFTMRLKMIDAEMYGMIPREKSTGVLKFPPVSALV